MRLLTRDLYEGAYLLSQGMKLNEIWIDRGNCKRAVVFEFIGDNVRLLRKDYQCGEAQINIIKLKSSLNELKDRMFSILRNDNTRLRKGRRDESIYRTGVRRAQEIKSN